MSAATSSPFPNAPDYQLSEVYSQDDETVTIWHRGPEDYLMRCSCGKWRDVAGGETQAINRAMDHVLDHDAAYEEALANAE